MELPWNEARHHEAAQQDKKVLDYYFFIQRVDESTP